MSHQLFNNENRTASRHKLAAVISWPPSPNLEIATNLKADCNLDRVSVPSPIAIDMLMDTMARDRAHMYLFSV